MYSIWKLLKKLKDTVKKMNKISRLFVSIHPHTLLVQLKSTEGIIRLACLNISKGVTVDYWALERLTRSMIQWYHTRRTVITWWMRRKFSLPKRGPGSEVFLRISVASWALRKYVQIGVHIIPPSLASLLNNCLWFYLLLARLTIHPRKKED